jgi:hypothetical protein
MKRSRQGSNSTADTHPWAWGCQIYSIRVGVHTQLPSMTLDERREHRLVARPWIRRYKNARPLSSTTLVESYERAGEPDA